MFLSIYAYTLLIFSSLSFALPRTPHQGKCSPFYTRFPEGTVARSKHDVEASAPPKPFIALPGSSYEEDAYGGPLSLHLDKPSGVKSTKDEQVIHINSVVAQGATVNSTFTLHYGRVSFNISAPTVPGVVTAAILISDAPSRDETDIEILGADPHSFQTNVFIAPPPGEEPLYGVNSGRHKIRGKPIDSFHVYTIDWTEDRVVWSVDGKSIRTLKRGDAKGHYPTQPSRIQLGIWDGSNPGGTAQWSGGPIDWSQIDRATARVRGVTVECP